MKQKSPEIDSHVYGESVFTKGTKTIKQRNDNLFKESAVKIRYPYAKIKINLNFYLTLYIKINSQWVTDLNGKAKTIRLLEENIKKVFITLGWANKFLQDIKT